MADLLMIGNDGQKIKSTNYWDSEPAARGYVFLTINAGAYRMLLPDSQFEMLIEMRKAQYVVISRGAWPLQNRADALEIMFEDNSDSPFALHIVPDMCDRMPGNKDVDKKRPFFVWTRSGQALELPCYFRQVQRLPWLKEYHLKT